MIWMDGLNLRIGIQKISKLRKNRHRGLGTMGYGLPAAVGVQIAHPEKLVIDIAGMTFVRAHADDFGIDSNFNEELDLHVHVPAGAIPGA